MCVLRARAGDSEDRRILKPKSEEQVFSKVRNFGNFSRLLEKNDDEKIGFYFFTYEWSRRRLSLIKMINGVEEALILLFTAFRYEYLF